MAAAAAIVACCRAGFETEAGLDLARIAARAGIALAVEAQPGAAYVVARTPRVDVAAWDRACAATAPVFTRAIAIGTEPVPLTSAPAPGARIDRVAPLVAAVDVLARERAHAPPWRSVWLEYPDTNEGKGISPLARALAPRVEEALRLRQALDEHAPRRLRVFLPDGRTAFVGTALAARGDWPLGIPRLRMPAGAPSRSTLKLAEAFTVFLGDDGKGLLRPGQRAVDLGRPPAAGRGSSRSGAFASPRSTTDGCAAKWPATRSSRTCARTASSGGRGDRSTGSSATSSNSRCASPNWSRRGSPTAPRAARSSTSSCR